VGLMAVSEGSGVQVRESPRQAPSHGDSELDRGWFLDGDCKVTAIFHVLCRYDIPMTEGKKKRKSIKKTHENVGRWLDRIPRFV
jgi:hypothetical protein